MENLTHPGGTLGDWHNNSSGNNMPSIYLSGKIYDYMGVPSEIMDEMKTAPSKGIFLNRRIKGHFPFKYVGH